MAWLCLQSTQKQILMSSIQLWEICSNWTFQDFLWDLTIISIRFTLIRQHSIRKWIQFEHPLLLHLADLELAWHFRKHLYFLLIIQWSLNHAAHPLITFFVNTINFVWTFTFTKILQLINIFWLMDIKNY
jgi:hypothetical protein